jgi:hypothetical protein
MRRQRRTEWGACGKPRGALYVEGGKEWVLSFPLIMDVVRNADWIVDLGREGGRVVFEGTPRQILDAPGSLTGQYLARPVPAAR